MLGVGVALAVLVTGWLLNQYFRWLPYPMDWVALSFHLGLSLLWLACGTLYVLDLSAAVGGAVIVGIAAVAFLHRFLGQPLLVSQFAGILVTAALSFLIAALALRRKARWKSEGEFLSARILHGVAPYFVYGVCYYLFLFADRLLAWTAQTTAFTMPIRFLGEYETALDIAMVAFVIESGWVHLSMLSFYRQLNNGQAHNSAADSPAFNRELRNYYFRRGAIFLPLATVTGFLTYGVAMHFGVLPTPGMQKVAVIAVASYPLLVWGLWNVGLFFALSRPRNALIAITAALSVNVGLGYLFSRVGNYNDAVFGFAVGSLVFALLTTVLFLRLCRTIDYCHFASAA